MVVRRVSYASTWSLLASVLQVTCVILSASPVKRVNMPREMAYNVGRHGCFWPMWLLLRLLGGIVCGFSWMQVIRETWGTSRRFSRVGRWLLLITPTISQLLVWAELEAQFA